jgi:putative lysine transport system substrate-binding protein
VADPVPTILSIILGEARRRKKWIALVLILVLASVAGAAAAETFRVGMECDYAPFNWTQSESSDTAVPIENGGYADGYDVQIARRIAEALGRDLVIVRTEWDGLTLAVTSGKIDAIIAGMSPTAERAVTIDFSDPYYESDLVVVVRKDSPYAAAQSLADLSGAKITGQLNTFHYSVVEQIPGVKKQTAMEAFPAMIVALNAGAVDGYVSERPGAVSAAAANPDLTFVAFAEGQGFVASPEDVAVAVGLKQGSDLREGINAALAGLDRAARQQLMDEAVARQPLSE